VIERGAHHVGILNREVLVFHGSTVTGRGGPEP
jgi:hypothetical protein